MTIAGNKALMNAAWGGSDECISTFIREGADVNIANCNGLTALHIAACKEHSQCLSKLIQAGADVNIRTEQGLTPLMEAAKRNKKTDCMTLLLKAGATINNKSLIGSNAMGLRLSREHNSSDGTMFLFAAGEILDMSLSKIPRYLQDAASQSSLKATCRNSIRRHLVDLEPHSHLFDRVTSLGLPSLLVSYLLHDISFG